MEKTDNLSLVPFLGSWSDLGDWNSIKNSQDKTDKHGNVSKGNVELHNVKESFVWSTKDAPLLAMSGVDNIVAVATKDAILVSNQSNSQSVKNLVEQLISREHIEAEYHKTDFRPWGNFETLICSHRYKVKRLCVDPAGVLSLQSHEHRSEHWVVTEGTATVQIEESIFELGQNESAYIPKKAKHRLSNNTEKPLVIIEVQTGNYLGEDDIVRYDDIYKRK